ncbi:MAG: hypothetical protein V4706_08780 [Pseudomonadota bacterium]
MKFNQSLTAAITAAALVAGAGFAVAQTSAPQVTNTPGDSSAQGPLTQNQGTTLGATGSMSSGSTMQAQPSTSMDTTTSPSTNVAPSVDTTLEPRADRN